MADPALRPAYGAGQRTRAAVAFSFAQDPGLVRTIRQAAAAAVRVMGLPETAVEEVRLAVGEACGVLIVRGGAVGDGRVQLGIDASPHLRVRIHCPAAAIPRQRGPQSTDPWTLLRGLVQGVVITEGALGTTIEMSWRR